MSTVPPVAIYLGAAGLLPTISALALVVSGRADLAALGFQVGTIYGALILSFIGGTWWGLAARGGTDALGGWLSVSVLPSLFAAVVLYLLDPVAVAALGAAFLVTPLVDRRLQAAGLAPHWWPRLRMPLSFAMGGLHLGLAALV